MGIHPWASVCRGRIELDPALARLAGGLKSPRSVFWVQQRAARRMDAPIGSERESFRGAIRAGVLGPPFVVTDDEMGQVVNRLDEALDAALRPHG